MRGVRVGTSPLLAAGLGGLLVGLLASASHAEERSAPDPDPRAPWERFSDVMTDLSATPGFVDAFLERVGRDPAAGGILGPDGIRRLREILLGERFEALDRFPVMTVAGMGRAVRVADRVAGPEPAGPDEPLVSTDPPAPEEDLGIPVEAASPEREGVLEELGFGLLVGDRVDPDRLERWADSRRLAEVLNRLALGDAYRVRVGAETHEDAVALLEALRRSGHELEIRDARYFANFGDLIYQGRDVLTPFWVDTEIRVPGTDRSLVVPVSHSQHELRVRGPRVNADLSFFFGIDGEAVYRTMETRDQGWTLGRVAHRYEGPAALEVVRVTGAIIRAYDRVGRRFPDLPFGGYYRLGVCNDVNAMIELHMQGATTLYPLTRDPAYFEGEGEVERLAVALPVDGRDGGPRDVVRVMGSLPVESLADLPFPALRGDLAAVRGAWERGELEDLDGGSPVPILLAAAALLLALGWRRRRRAPG